MTVAMAGRSLAPLLLVLLSPSFVRAAEPSGREIMERVNARPRAATSVRRMSLTTEPTDRKPPLEIVMYQRDDGAQTSTLLTVTRPSELAGLTVLVREESAKVDHWLYAPVLQEALAFGPEVAGLRLFQTQFTLTDVHERFRLDAYEFYSSKVRAASDGQSVVVDAEVVEPSVGYGRIVGSIDLGRATVTKAKYFDRQGRAIKTFRAVRIERIDGFWTPRVLAMRSARNGVVDCFRILDVRNGVPLPDDLFDSRSLAQQRGRCFPAPCDTH